MYTILLVTHTIIVLFLIVLVLIQRSSSDGLGGLGGGGNQFLTGRASANLLTRTTAILAGAFMCTSLVLAIMASRMSEGSVVDSIVDSVPVEQSAPVVPLEKTAPPAKVTAPVKKTTPAVPKGE
jgi:preprotein translocase subunit SecG